MKVLPIVAVSCMCLCLGVIYYACVRHWIIIQWPTYSCHGNDGQLVGTANTTSISILYWSTHEWKTETSTIVATDDRSQTLKQILSEWLRVIDDNGCLPKKVKLETTMVSSSGTDLFISFSHTIFGKNQSIFQRWLLMESLLKTIHAYDPLIARVRLLVHHQPLPDHHLDFSSWWPIHGFIEKK